MLTEYVQAAMRRAKFKDLGEGEGYFGRITGFRGVWANASSLNTCRTELREVLESWMLVRVRLGLSLPVIDGINLNLKKQRRKVA